MMISLKLAVLLAAAAAVAIAWDPDCENCPYYNGIGFVKSDEFCSVYYVCYKDPYKAGKYKWKIMCCAEGLKWDEEHLTCSWIGYPKTCNDSREKCPDIPTTTNLPCPYYPVRDDPSKFTDHDEIWMCPYGQIWVQDICTCDFGPEWIPRACDKILHFDFDGTFDSYSCYNFAKGDPYGNPPIYGGALCLDGNQMLSIGFLNNYWAWNPNALKFTICFWFYPDVPYQNAGLLSINCEFQTQGSVAEICLHEGRLVGYLGTYHDLIGGGLTPPVNVWTKVCVTYNYGQYCIFVDGKEVYPKPPYMPKNAAVFGNGQVHTTLGYKKGLNPFEGYMDDFCFWTTCLSADDIHECFKKGPSSTIHDDPHKEDGNGGKEEGSS